MVFIPLRLRSDIATEVHESSLQYENHTSPNQVYLSSLFIELIFKVKKVKWR